MKETLQGSQPSSLPSSSAPARPRARPPRTTSISRGTTGRSPWRSTRCTSGSRRGRSRTSPSRRPPAATP